jgi:NADPH:quinone reductase-like Zn-dependent oxidoreductase
MSVMKAYCIERPGVGVDGLLLGERPEPTPGPDEVLVRVRARTVNYRDIRILAGLYPVPGRDGVIALSDGAGEVVAVGDGVTRVTIGDRVAATYFPQWTDGPFRLGLATDQFGCTRDGMLAPFVVANEAAVVKIPAHLSFDEAACLPCAGLTAWSALIGPRPILPGESVLTIGTGGVALFALQFAKLFGARVIAITSTDEKAELLKRLGADDTINYTCAPDWDRAVRECVDGRGVDHVVETGSVNTLARSIASAAEGGIVTFVAALENGSFDPRCLLNPVLLRRIYVGSRASFEAMNRAISLHQLRPVIDRVFGFADAKAAYQYYEARRHVGKVVISGD